MGSECDNRSLAGRLREAADLLEGQGADRFRVGAYRAAASTLEELPREVSGIYDEKGTPGLTSLHRIGPRIAAALAEMITTGRWGQLERLRGTSSPEDLFRTLPGVGPALARRIHETLHVDTLEDLERAAHDGRLEKIPGVGARRALSLRASLDAALSRVRRRPRRGSKSPTVALLLEIDEIYRRRGEEGSLPTIAPARLNPGGKSWLPVLHLDRSGWHFTALFSNTPLAHDLGRVGDWVVIYYQDDEGDEGQSTVVSERGGPLAGLRVVRGREEESRRHYRDRPVEEGRT